MAKAFVCKACGSSMVQVFRIPKESNDFLIFVLCKECNSVNEGRLIELEKKKSQEAKNEAR